MHLKSSVAGMTKKSVHNIRGLNVWRVVVQRLIEIPTVQEGGATNATKWCQSRVQKAISISGFILYPGSVDWLFTLAPGRAVAFFIYFSLNYFLWRNLMRAVP
jgi:hypothetical protein